MRKRIVCLAVAACCALAGACGDRTGLLVDDLAPADAATEHASPEAGLDAGADALPGIDASHHEAGLSSCPDAGATLVYVLTEQNEIYSFYPPTLAFTLVGKLACPSSSVPFSMAVDRKGVAYAVFNDGNLFRVSTATAACVATTFAPGQHGFTTFGMGYVADSNDAGETLFVAQADVGSMGASAGLAFVDTTSMTLHFIAPFAPPIPFPELTGTGGAGRLFAFYTNRQGTGSHVVEVDKTTGRLIADNALRVGSPNDGYAFAFWGGDIWIFTSPNGPSQITRFRTGDSSETPMGTMPSTIVGAGVSTCAPE